MEEGRQENGNLNVIFESPKEVDGFSVFPMNLWQLGVIFSLSFPVCTSGPVFSSMFLATSIPCLTLEVNCLKGYFHGTPFPIMLPRKSSRYKAVLRFQ